MLFSMGACPLSLFRIPGSGLAQDVPQGQLQVVKQQLGIHLGNSNAKFSKGMPQFCFSQMSHIKPCLKLTTAGRVEKKK